MKRGRGLARVSERQQARQRDLARMTAARRGGRCKVRIEDVCEGTGVHYHHIVRRSQGGDDSDDNLLWTCTACHNWIHANPARAYGLGLLVRSAPTRHTAIAKAASSVQPPEPDATARVGAASPRLRSMPAVLLGSAAAPSVSRGRTEPGVS